MTTEIVVQVTSQELRIPLAGLEAWNDAELEVVRESQAIVIRPRKPKSQQERELAIQALREDGLLVEPQNLPSSQTAPKVLRETGGLYKKAHVENTAQITAQGVFIPQVMVQQWSDIEVIAETQRIIIQPKKPALTEEERTIQTLESCGFLLSSEPLPEDYVPLSEEEKEELRQALSIGKPLSQIVIEDREERW